MSHNVIKDKREEKRRRFLSLSPAERVERMEAFFRDCVRLYASKEGISEDEAYKRIVERDRTFNRRVL